MNEILQRNMNIQLQDDLLRKILIYVCKHFYFYFLYHTYFFLKVNNMMILIK